MSTLSQVQNIKDDGSADIYLYTHIGGEGGIDGQAFANHIQFLSEVQKVKVINVHINSPGGSVFDGMSIFNAIRNVDAEVHTYIDGTAASIAGVIAMAGDKRYMNDFGRLMIHMASIPGAGQLDDREKEAIKQISEQIGHVLKNNSRVMEQHIFGMMERETWMTADMALDMGFVDEVVNTDREVGVILANASVQDVYNSISQILNSNTNPKQLSMKEVKNSLGLEEAASEEVVLGKVQDLQNSLDEVSNTVQTQTEELSSKDSEIEELKQEISSLKETIESFKEKEIVSTVENYIEAGKFEKEKKDSLIENAKSIGLDTFKNFADSITTGSHVDITNHISVEKDEEVESFRDLEKNNPSKLNTIKNENPELFNKMFKAEYGVDYKF